MKIVKKIVAGVTILIGIIFIANTASDIQLGSGVIMIAVGVLGL